jgi:hypothetical protein
MLLLEKVMRNSLAPIQAWKCFEGDKKKGGEQGCSPPG